MTIAADVKSMIRSAVPRAALQQVKRMLHAGTERHCVVCSSDVKAFLPQGYGYPMLEALKVVGGMSRPDDECPVCRSNSRTRLVWLYVAHHSDLLAKPGRFLHVAPEPGLADIFAANARIDYVPADLDRSRYRHLPNLHTFDLQQAPFEKATFDWVICNHVLEHIPDDRRAMREICRILKPGGRAILQVPISLVRETTDEDATVTSEMARIARFGQRDHVRLYARDYYVRLREAGFDVELWNAFEYDAARAAEWRLDPEERLVVARPRAV
jgi:SAM-dependent methyltransferase